MGDFSQKILAQVFDWANDPKDFLFVYSTSGTGKTHLGCAVAKDLCSRGINCGFVIGPEIFLRLRKSFDRNAIESEWDIIKKYRKPIVGVFDDICANGCKDYVVEAWYGIINHRYNECIPTMFTSNNSLSEISEIMGDRIASRLASGIVFELKGEDRRLKK